jgi:hypothetical protein
MQSVLLAAALQACSSSTSSTSPAASGDSTSPAGSGATTTIDTSDLDVQIVPSGGTSLPLGRAFAFTLSIRNNADKSITVPVHLALVPPAGDPVPFYDTSLFVPFRQEATEDVVVTPTQWFPALGTYSIAVTLDQAPSDATARFDVVAPDILVPRFDDVTSSAGVTSTVPAPTCGQFANGSAWADVDGDGDLDLFVTRLGERTQLFVNNGHGSFADEAAARGIAINDANGGAFADYDNDGDEDLYVARDGSDAMFRNDGGTFTDVSVAAGIGDDGRRGMSAAWGDYDGDGNVDVYVTNYMHCLGDWRTEEEIIAQVSYDPDALYHNNGDGTFTDVTSLLEKDATAYDDGTTLGAGFTAAWFDYNDDNRPDLYLANDFVGPSPDHNRLWRNDGSDGAGGWKFTDVSLDSGTAFFMNTMGIGISDFDRDGDLDFALSNITASKLLRNDGNGVFVEDTTSGSARPMQRSTISSITWGTNFFDLNLDGWDDLYFAAGNFQQAPGIPVGVQPNELFVNDGSGTTFLDVSSVSGADDPGDSKGVSFADYDADGDMDMYVTNQGGESHLFQNATDRGDNHWLEVATVGTVSNRDGCGARLVLTTSSGPIVREVLCGSGGSGSANQRIVHFGLGDDAAVSSLEIRWPSGTAQVVAGRDISVDQIITIEEAAT